MIGFLAQGDLAEDLLISLDLELQGPNNYIAFAFGQHKTSKMHAYFYMSVAASLLLYSECKFSWVLYFHDPICTADMTTNDLPQTSKCK